MACLAARPIVDGLEKEWAQKVQFLHLEFRSRLGREMGRHFGIEHIPAFLILDGAGQLHWRERNHMPRRSEISAQLKELLSEQKTTH